MRVPLSRPDINEVDRRIVLEVLATDTLSIGPRVSEFESAVAKGSNNKYGIAVNSGTSGLHLLVRALDIAKGDEVITTPFSFVASSNALLYEGAVPRFVDIDETRLDISPEAIAEALGPRTRAVLPVDVFGQPALLDKIRELASNHGLKVIEDSCEALGAEYKGKPVGHPDFCDGAVFAFYPNKQITTGEGGVIVTANEQVARECYSMRNQGRGESGLWLSHERLGYNYRLDEMSAALGVSQFARLDDILRVRQSVADEYARQLANIAGITPPYVAVETTRMSWFVYVVRFDPHVNRDALMQWLSAQGVGCRPYFTPIHLQPFYRRQFGFKEGDFPVTERVAESTLALPFYNTLSSELIAYVVDRLKVAVEKFGR